MAKAILEKKSSTEGTYSLTSDYTTKLESQRQYGIGILKRHTEQCKKIKIPEINIGTYCQLIYDKGRNNGEKSQFKIWCCET